MGMINYSIYISKNNILTIGVISIVQFNYCVFKEKCPKILVQSVKSIDIFLKNKLCGTPTYTC